MRNNEFESDSIHVIIYALDVQQHSLRYFVPEDNIVDVLLYYDNMDI